MLRGKRFDGQAERGDTQNTLPDAPLSIKTPNPPPKSPIRIQALLIAHAPKSKPELEAMQWDGSEGTGEESAGSNQAICFHP